MLPSLSGTWKRTFTTVPSDGSEGVSISIPPAEMLRATASSPAKPSPLKVMEATPAQRAGLHDDDVVLAIDGQHVATPTELVSRVQEKGVGETVKLALRRAGKELSATMSLEARPDELALLRQHLVGKKA